MYSDPNPQDHYSELFIIYGETLAVWDAAEPNPDEKFKKNTIAPSLTDWKAGAGDGDRTRDIQLGKLAFYR